MSNKNFVLTIGMIKCYWVDDEKTLLFRQNGTNFYMHEREIFDALVQELKVDYSDLGKFTYVHMDNKDHNGNAKPPTRRELRKDSAGVFELDAESETLLTDQKVITQYAALCPP
jgi:hypothetical protein